MSSTAGHMLLQDAPECHGTVLAHPATRCRYIQAAPKMGLCQLKPMLAVRRPPREIVLTRDEVSLAKGLPAGAFAITGRCIAMVTMRRCRCAAAPSVLCWSHRGRRGRCGNAGKSLNDLKPKALSLNDGSIRFIWALTAELWSHSASSFSWPMRSARSSSPVAAACGSAGDGSSSGSGALGLRPRLLGSGPMRRRWVSRAARRR
jgi:hypothetical protein